MKDLQASGFFPDRFPVDFPPRKNSASGTSYMLLKKFSDGYCFHYNNEDLFQRTTTWEKVHESFVKGGGGGGETNETSPKVSFEGLGKLLG